MGTIGQVAYALVRRKIRSRRTPFGRTMWFWPARTLIRDGEKNQGPAAFGPWFFSPSL